MPEHIEECFEYVGEVMHPHSIFYFTFFEAEEYKRTGRKSFSYPYSFFAALAERTGFRLEDFAARYPHPVVSGWSERCGLPGPRRSPGTRAVKACIIRGASLNGHRADAAPRPARWRAGSAAGRRYARPS
jgi:hypothetical protein